MITTDRWRITVCDPLTGEPQTSSELLLSRKYDWHPDRLNLKLAEIIAQEWTEDRVQLEEFRRHDDKVMYRVTVRPWEVSDAREAVRVTVQVELKFMANGMARAANEDWAVPL